MPTKSILVWFREGRQMIDSNTRYPRGVIEHVVGRPVFASVTGDIPTLYAVGMVAFMRDGEVIGKAVDLELVGPNCGVGSQNETNRPIIMGPSGS